MRKLLLSVLATVGILTLMPAVALADPVAIGTSTIAGTITHNGSPVSGANVVVTCNGNPAGSSTTSAGAYIVTFSAAACPPGSTASVAASKGADSGTNSGTVNGLTTDINLAIVNVSVVPELGLVTGAAAGAIGIGSFLVIRRRQINTN